MKYLLTVALPFLLSTAALTARGNNESVSSLTEQACSTYEQAHAALLDSCFSVNREVTVTLNDKLRAHERARLQYTPDGAELFDVEILEEDKNLILDGEGKDMILSVPFDCDRLRASAEALVLHAGDEPERAEFQLDQTTGALRPHRWVFETTERFLFRKFRIRAEAIYSGYIMHQCAGSN